MLKKIKAAALVLAVSAISVNAMAATTPPDYSVLIDAVDFGAIGTTILAIAAIVAGILALQRGVKMALASVKS
jgi:hypothetical protein